MAAKFSDSQTGPHPTEPSPSWRPRCLSLIAFLEQRQAQADGAEPPTMGIIGIDAKGQEESVHGPTQAVAEAIGLGEQFANRAVQEEVFRHFAGGTGAFLHDFQWITLRKVLHDRHQFVFRQFANGGKCLGDNFVMAAMIAENKIIPIQQESLADSHRFLTHGEVRRAG